MHRCAPAVPGRQLPGAAGSMGMRWMRWRRWTRWRRWRRYFVWQQWRVRRSPGKLTISRKIIVISDGSLANPSRPIAKPSRNSVVHISQEKRKKLSLSPVIFRNRSRKTLVKKYRDPSQSFSLLEKSCGRPTRFSRPFAAAAAATKKTTPPAFSRDLSQTIAAKVS